MGIKKEYTVKRAILSLLIIVLTFGGLFTIGVLLSDEYEFI